jgi:hypothetical protein
MLLGIVTIFANALLVPFLACGFKVPQDKVAIGASQTCHISIDIY